MVVYNAGSKELTAKIVYYGPGLGGKTTNLQFLHRRLEPSSVGNLLTLAATADRTIFFDLLPVELGELKGYRIRFQVATVPGQAPYNETRRVVLRGVDGIVFVVDSRWSMLPKNLESFQNLKDNLKEEGIAIESLPVVIQFNKRDLPDVLAVDALQEGLGLGSLPYIEAVASEGKGAVETFKLISKLTFVDILRRLQKKGIARAPRPSAAPSSEVSKSAAWKDAVESLAAPAPLRAVPAERESAISQDESATRAIPVPSLQSPFFSPDETNPGLRMTSERQDALVQETFAPFPESPTFALEDTNPAFLPGAASPPASTASTTASFPVFESESLSASEEPEITAPLSVPEASRDSQIAALAGDLSALERRLGKIEETSPWLSEIDDLRTSVANQRLASEKGFAELRSAAEKLQSEIADASSREMELVAQSSRMSLGVAASLEKLGSRIQETEEKFSQLAIDQESRLSRLERLVEEQSRRSLQEQEAQHRAFQELREALSSTLGDLAEKLRRAANGSGPG